jgi:hypothetical protein
VPEYPHTVCPWYPCTRDGHGYETGRVRFWKKKPSTRVRRTRIRPTRCPPRVYPARTRSTRRQITMYTISKYYKGQLWDSYGLVLWRGFCPLQVEYEGIWIRFSLNEETMHASKTNHKPIIKISLLWLLSSLSNQRFSIQHLSHFATLSFSLPPPLVFLSTSPLN